MTEDISVPEWLDPDAIQAIKEALQQMNESMITFSKAVYDALEDASNPNHEVVTALIGKKAKSHEQKLPKKLRKGWS